MFIAPVDGVPLIGKLSFARMRTRKEWVQLQVASWAHGWENEGSHSQSLLRHDLETRSSPKQEIESFEDW